MTGPALDLSPLANAIDRLSEGLVRAGASPEDDLFRDGVIQRFEYTYELCHKMLRRHLENDEDTPGATDALGFPDLIRVGAERGLLRNSWDVWLRHRTARGTTSHTYDAQKAAWVYAQVPAFLDDARALLGRTDSGEGMSAASSDILGLDLTPDETAIVLTILTQSAPRPCRVGVFGSRATGRAKRFSDLDLAFDAGRPLTFGELGALEEAFTESALPWRVDLADLHAMSDAFRAIVDASARPLLDLELSLILPHTVGEGDPEGVVGARAPLRR